MPLRRNLLFLVFGIWMSLPPMRWTATRTTTVVPLVAAADVSSNYYESPRSLDKYGNAVQLRHAQAACTHHGRLIVAVRFRNDVWVLSPFLSDRDPPLQSKRSQPLPLLFPVNPLVVPADVTTAATAASSPGVVALVCSGLQADARWLEERLCGGYAKPAWERYDSELSLVATAEAVARLKRSFWNYEGSDDPDNPAWEPLYEPEGMGLGEGGSSNGNGGNNNGVGWARPLGVTSLVLEAAPASSSRGAGNILLVDPSGIVRHVANKCVCIGQRGAEVQRVLEEKLRDWNDDNDHDHASTHSEGDLKAVLLQVLSSCVPSIDRVLVEVLSDRAITQQIWPVLLEKG